MNKLIIVFLSGLIFSMPVKTSESWNLNSVSISDTLVSTYEYGTSLPDKAIFLWGGTGIVGSMSELQSFNDLGDGYLKDGKQLVILSIPYFGDERNSIESAAQEVLNILDFGLKIGYLNQGYTLIGGSSGSLIISAMLDFNQFGENKDPRLIDNVGRVVMLAGPHHNVAIQSPSILDLMASYDVTSLISLNESLTFEDRKRLYLAKLAPNVKIVIGDSDHIFCAINSPCSVDMNIITNNWLIKLTGQQYELDDMQGIVKILPGVGHELPIEQYIDFII